jgi:hypothetical protein
MHHFDTEAGLPHFEKKLASFVKQYNHNNDFISKD